MSELGPESAEIHIMDQVDLDTLLETQSSDNGES